MNNEEETEPIPFIAIGADELKGNLGDKTRCPSCNEIHEVKQSEPPLLQYVKCDISGETYLVGIKNKAIK